MATNLSELRAEVKDWGNRANISDSLVDSFINTAQNRANRILRLPDMEASATLTVASGIAAIPSDYEEVKELLVSLSSGNRSLERKDIIEVDKYATYTGDPCIFARKLTNFHMSPAVNDIVEVELYYYIKLPALVADSDTNIFITNSPDLLKYGALTELFLFIRDDQNAAVYEAKFRAVMQELQGVEDKAAWSGGPLRVSL